MFEQLGLFDCPPPPEPTPDVAKPPLPPDPRSQWWEGQAAFYLRLMGRFMRPDAVCSQAVRSHEIERLHRLRQEALAKIGGV